MQTAEENIANALDAISETLKGIEITLNKLLTADSGKGVQTFTKKDGSHGKATVFRRPR